MTHDSAVRTVVSLVPEMEKSGAEKVLTDYATKEDLPPAQLEKLAQVYNTLRTVSHIDHASEAERGATVSLVDVPTLVVGYATGAHHEKAAAGPQSFSSHDSTTVDLNRALKFELNGGLQKAAAEVTAPAAEVNQAMAHKLSAEESADALMDLSLDLRDEMSKLACAIYDAAPRCEDNYFLRDVSEFEEEALQHQPVEAVKAAGAFMEQFAGANHTKLDRFEYDREITKYAYEIPHAMGRKFAELAKVTTTYNLIEKVASGDPEAVEAIKKAMEAHPDDDSGDPGITMDLTGAGPVNKEVVDPDAKEMTDEEKARASTEAEEAAKGGEGLTSATEDEKEDGDKDSKDSKDSNNSNNSKDSKDSKDSKGGLNIGAIGGAIASPFAAAGGAIRGAAAKADETLSRITTKERQNKSQRATDVSVEDIKRAMNIRRMIGTDPVLRDADPKEVLEVYNSIAQKNPDVASDMASLRLILREAVSYEGLTLDAQKMLAETRRNSEDASAKAEENDKRRYAVGGVNPLSNSK